MRILVLGGTSFVGRAIVADALRTGAEVTLFSRGKTGAGLFPEARWLAGDRDTGDYAALDEGRWDAVVDVSGYVPRHTGQAMDALGDRVGRYLFISSHAVYEQDGARPQHFELGEELRVKLHRYGPAGAAQRQCVLIDDDDDRARRRIR